MKSHIVIFTGGIAPKPKETLAYWNSPLCFGGKKEIDFVVAADSGFETLDFYRRHSKAFAERFEPRLVVGDFDSIADERRISKLGKIVERAEKHKDLTDTELALSAARSRFKNAFVTLVGGAGGRADHFLGIYDLFGSSLAPDAWICGEQVLYWTRGKKFGEKFIVRGLRPGQPVSVARAGGKVGGKISTRGLEWEAEKFRPRGMPSISNEISRRHFEKSLPVEISFERGNFVLILPLSANVEIAPLKF